MIRQAHTYLVGALSGVTLIGIAIGVFVVLVSAQVFHDWPIAALGGTDQKAAVAPAKALPSPDRAHAAAGATATAARPRAAKAAARNGAVHPKPAVHHHAAPAAAPTQVATGPAEVVESAPSQSSGGEESSPAGNHSGSHPAPPSPASPPPSSSSPGSGSGGSTESSKPSSAATASSGSTGTGAGSGSGGGGGNSGPTGSSPVTTVTAPVTAATKQPAQVVTETVNGTVAGVDETVLGGTLEKTGVTHVTEEVVNGVAGSESVVGKTVNGVGEVVGGLLGGGGH